jgi:peroxiredoxin
MTLPGAIAALSQQASLRRSPMLKVGDKFPNIKLEGTQGGENKTYDLSSSGGKHRVFIFYPFAFTAN